MGKRERLAELRKKRGWLQKDVVKFLRERYGIVITDRYYGMFEQGARRPPLHIALALSDLFEQPIEVLFPDQKPNRVFGETISVR